MGDPASAQISPLTCQRQTIEALQSFDLERHQADAFQPGLWKLDQKRHCLDVPMQRVAVYLGGT